MKLITHSHEMTQAMEEARRVGKRIAFIPTMGALHEGHLALFLEGKKRADVVVASIFVNPTQFNSQEDFEKYPKDLEGDLKKCKAAGVDFVFIPAREEIYPARDKKRPIPLPRVAGPLEGVFRPGHFEGVVDVVTRLFEIVHPHVAIFGLKDYQQFRVIQDVTQEQILSVEIHGYPTIREKSGLAVSSRNKRLSEGGLKKAENISKALKTAGSLFQKGERKAEKMEEHLREGLVKEGISKIDYVKIVDAMTLEDLETIDRPALVAIAIFVEGVRLIDNCILSPS